jgi:uncharacterized protein (TIGR02596 family)
MINMSTLNTKQLLCSRSHFQRASRAGFSMIEMLVVIAIMSVLAYSVSSVSFSLQESNNIASAGQTVVDELAVARGYAASHNQSVYVRFITSTGSTNTGYTAIQLWQADPTNPGDFSAVDQVVRLPHGIEISANPTLSPLVTTLVTGSTCPMPPGSNAPGNFVSFVVRPDGNVVVAAPPSVTGTALQNMPYYFLTVLPVRYDSSSAVPSNYVTIQVNPDTAIPQVFQP